MDYTLASIEVAADQCLERGDCGAAAFCSDLDAFLTCAEGGYVFCYGDGGGHGYDHSNGNGYGYGYSYGNGDGDGCFYSFGNGHGYGYGDGDCDGNGYNPMFTYEV